MEDPEALRAAQRRQEDSDRSDRLRRRLLEWSRAEGAFGFDRYMDLVLYDPVDGYYRHRAADPVGPQGDFYTAPDLGPAFGSAVARRIVAEFHRLDDPAMFQVAEVGPGRGVLAASVIQALGQSDVPSGRWTYSLVGEGLGTSQAARSRVEPAANETGIDVRTRPTLGSEGPFTGVVLANELLDALPARRLEYRNGAWQELGVRWDEAGGQWVLLDRAVDLHNPMPPPADGEGNRLEYTPAAAGFLREVADHLVRGTAVLIDYGDEELELVRGHPEGTLRAVRRHRVVADPLETPGLTDLSTFVNLTRVRGDAERAGLVDRGLRSQAVALGDWGVTGILEAWTAAAESEVERVRRRLQGKNLLFGFDGFFVWELEARGQTTLAPT